MKIFQPMGHTYLTGQAPLFVFIAILLMTTVLAKASGNSHSVEVGISMITSVILLIIGLILLVLVIPTRSQSRHAEESIREYREGRYLAHWTYEPEEREAILQARLQYRYRKSRHLFQALLGMSLFFSTFLVLAGKDQDPTTPTAKYFVLSIGITFFLTLGITTWVRTWARIQARNQRQYGGHAFIGATSAYFSGDYLFWTPPNRYLMEARLEEKDNLWLQLRANVVDTTPSLFFDLITLFFHQPGVNTKNNITFIHVGDQSVMLPPTNNQACITIPVPNGRRAEAEKIIQILRKPE